jgi:large subunit ribosomal protein L33
MLLWGQIPADFREFRIPSFHQRRGPRSAAEALPADDGSARRSGRLVAGGRVNAMAKKKGGRGKKKAETVFLVCEESGDYNYTLRRKPGGEKLKLKKYCPRLRRHTLHVEKKK